MVTRSASPRHMLNDAVASGDLALARKAIRLGARVDAMRPSGEGSFFQFAVALARPEFIALFLEAAPWTPHELGLFARSAIASQDVGALRLVIGHGLDLDAIHLDSSGADGDTLANYGCLYGAWTCVGALLDAGASPDARGWSGWTPLMCCARGPDDPHLLATAARLLDLGADAEARENTKSIVGGDFDRFRALDIAARQNCPLICELLIARGNPAEQAPDVARLCGNPDLATQMDAWDLARSERAELGLAISPSAPPPARARL